jgi:hypothetical protein
MASYTNTQLYGTGSIGETISSGVEKLFTFTNPGGSSYFTMETIPASTGFFEGTSPKNFSGSFVVSASMGLVTSSYIASIVVQPGTQSFKFTPAINVTGTTYYLKGTGMYSLNIASTAAPVAPVNTYPPALSYVYRYEGETVTTDDGTWDNSPTSFTYQWYRDATPISGETLNQYTLTAADVDTDVSCEVTAINAGGSATEPSDAIYIFDYDYGQVYYYAEDTNGAKSILQNQFMLAIKAAGVWAKLDVLCVFRGSGYANAHVDWKRLIQVTNNECAFDTTQGFIGSSTFVAAYIDTNFVTNAGTNYTQDNASRYFFPYAFSGTGPMEGNQYNVMNLGGTTINKINSEDVLNSAFQYTTTVEPKSIHRTSDTDVTLFNGTTSASRTNTSEVNGAPLIILTQGGDYAAHTVAAYAAGASMVAENTAFVAAWNTYITAL